MNEHPSNLGWWMAWALGRSVRTLGTLLLWAVLYAAPIALCGVLSWARIELGQMRTRTDRAVAVAERASREVARIERERAQTQAAFVPTVPAFETAEAREARCATLDIERIAPGRYAIARDAVDCLLAQPTLMRPVRIVPEARDGRVIGVRVLRVDPEGAMHRLGLRSGDVLLRVNGMDIASPDHCLTAYSRLRHGGILTVDLLRGGRSTELRYYILG